MSAFSGLHVHPSPRRRGRRHGVHVSFLLALAATVMTFGFLYKPSDILWLCIMGFCTLLVFGGYRSTFRTVSTRSELGVGSVTLGVSSPP